MIMISDVNLKELLLEKIKNKEGLIIKKNDFNKGFFTIKIPFSFYYNNLKNKKEKFSLTLIMSLKYNMDFNAYYYDIKVRLPSGEEVLFKEIFKKISNFKEEDIIDYLFKEENRNISPELEERLRIYCYKRKVGEKMIKEGYKGGYSDYRKFLKKKYDNSLDKMINDLMKDITTEEIKETIRRMYKENGYEHKISSIIYLNEIEFLTSFKKEISFIYKETESLIKSKSEVFIYSKDLFEGAIIYVSLDGSSYLDLTKNTKNIIYPYMIEQYFQNLANNLKSIDSLIVLINEYFRADPESEICNMEKTFKISIFQEYFFKITNLIHEKTDIRPFFKRELIKNIISYGRYSIIDKEGTVERIITAAISYFINKEGVELIYNKADSLELKTEKFIKILQFLNLFPDMNFLTEDKKISILKEYKSLSLQLKKNKKNEYEMLFINYKIFLYKNIDILPEAKKEGLIEKTVFNNKNFSTELKEIFNQQIKVGVHIKKIFAYFTDVDINKNSIFSYKFPENYKELKSFGEFNLIKKYFKIKEQKEKIKQILKKRKQK